MTEAAVENGVPGYGVPGTDAEIEVSLAAVVPDNAEDDLRSLLRWLREDESLKGQVRGRIRDSASPMPGSMGTVFDIVQLTIGSGLSVGSLVVSFLQWRDARSHPPGITLRHGRTTVEISATGEIDADSLTRALQFLTAPHLPEDPLPVISHPAEEPVTGDALAYLPFAETMPATEVGPEPMADEAARAAHLRIGEAAGDGTPS